MPSLPHSPLTLVILAAGRASRFGSPKQWVPVGPRGEPLLAYSLAYGWQAGFSHAVVVVAEGQAGPESLTSFIPRGMHMRLVEQRVEALPGLSAPPERERPWGTAHAVWSARPAVNGDFAVLNADDYYGPEALQLLAAFLQKPAEASLLVAYVLKNTLSSWGPVSRGVCSVSSGMLTRIEEHTQVLSTPEGIGGVNAQGLKVSLAPDTLVSMNCWGLREAFWPVLEEALLHFSCNHANAHSSTAECYLPAAIGRGLAQNPVLVRPTSSPWAGLTYLQDLPQVQQWVEKTPLFPVSG